MSFGVGLTGLKGAQTDLDVTGHNIANAGTVGFKQSRVEFGDLYAANVSGGVSSGQGVNINQISQQFTQGDITFTENSLDLAINGEGFFVAQNELGEQFYTRAGMFSLDNEGFVVTNTGMRVQGFGVPSELQLQPSPNPSRPLGNIQIDDADMAPNRTTDVASVFNLDATSDFVTGGVSANTNGTDVSVPQQNSTTNGYDAPSAGALQVVNAGFTPLQVVSDVTWNANDSANAIAGNLSTIEGVTASATTTANLTSFFDAAGNGTAENIILNGNLLTATDPANAPYTVQDIVNEISSLPNFTAQLNTDAAGNPSSVTVVNALGNDIQLNMQAGSAGTVNVEGVIGGNAVAPVAPDVPGQALGAVTAGVPVTVGGYVDITLDPGLSLVNNTANPSAVANDPDLQVIGYQPTDTTPLTQFSSQDSTSYNHSTSVTVFDSLGNSHVMTQYFVKEPPTYDGNTHNPNQNTWTMYVQIDGYDVGPANPAYDPTQPESATNSQNLPLTQSLVFDVSGQLASANPATPLLVDNWVPRDSEGNPNGSDGPALGEQPLIPPVNSNFVIDITSSTQFASQFAINSLEQDGFSTGTLVGLDVESDGQLVGRYTNGETRTFSYIAMANFANEQGLVPNGDTMWRGSAAAGEAVINLPGTAALGRIQSAALESSNVDLSDELVGLIIAQRNYQANAKTIETENTISQTILNI